MIVDSSALVAVLREEGDASEIRRILAEAPRVAVGAPTVLETSIVVGTSRHGDLDNLLREVGAAVVPFTAEHAVLAREAYSRYGRRSGSRARLNFGDAMSYAVAKVAADTLLFKGDDFTHTDVEAAR